MGSEEVNGLKVEQGMKLGPGFKCFCRSVRQLTGGMWLVLGCRSHILFVFML